MCGWGSKRWVLLLTSFCMIFGRVGVSAADTPPELEPILSLTGNCSTSALDPIPDPGCPDPPHPGRFQEPRSVAIDAYGNEFVANCACQDTKTAQDGAIDIFDPEGFYITTLADPNGPQSVAVDSEGNLYVYERFTEKVVRYAPSVYEPEAGEIAYANPPVDVFKSNSVGNGLAIDFSNDHLYAARGTALSEYSSAVEGNSLLDTITPGLSWSHWVAVDAERRRLYVSTCRDEIFECGALVLSADGEHELLKEVFGPSPAKDFVSLKGWLSIAVNEESGHFFVDDLEGEGSKSIYEFDEDYELVSELALAGFQGGQPLQIAVSNSPLDVEAFNHNYLFVPVLKPSAGQVLAFEPPGELAPEILEAGTGSIGETEAQLRATIDPRGGQTDYRFEYVTQAAFEEEGFANPSLAAAGTIPGTNLATEVQTFLTGLAAGVGYRFRVVAKNEAGDAEPVEASFTTYSDAPTITGSCPNEALRIGPSPTLPDCRAYELVTPPDTNGHAPLAAGGESDRFLTLEASPGGSIISFLLEGGVLPGTEGTGGFHGDPYRATRGPGGWTSTAAGPSGTEASATRGGGISPDQGYSFWEASEKGSAVIEGAEARYVRYPDGHSEPIGRGSLGTEPSARGKFISENGTHIVFQTSPLNAIPALQLEPNAPPTGTRAVYDRTADEVTHVVSLLPGDKTPAAGEGATYIGASADGNGIAFEIGTTLYLRKDNAVTYEIGTGVTFAGVSEGGERIFYVEGGDLLAFDTETEEVVPFSETGDVTVVNVAPGGARAYFVSPSVLGEENPNGALAQAGEENLYLSEEGAISFVGTVTALDVEGESKTGIGKVNGLGLWTDSVQGGALIRDPSRLTPAGMVFLFQSRADLDGQGTGGTPQIYRFDASASRLDCLSCIPTEVPTGGGANLTSVSYFSESNPPLHLTAFVPNLRADGRRAFFESEEALVSGDTDGVRDVYEWEAQGVGSCTRADGCVYLISSGHSERPNFLYGHSASGDDVFFSTGDVLNGFDGGGTPSIYDARVNGGFEEPQAAPCQGEGCRPNLSPSPQMSNPESGVRPQSGNVGKTCPKGKRKMKHNGKVRCVKKKHGKNKGNKQKKTNSSKGAGR